MIIDRVPPKDVDRPSLQDLLDLAEDQGDYQAAAMLKAQIEEEGEEESL